MYNWGFKKLVFQLKKYFSECSFFTTGEGDFSGLPLLREGQLCVDNEWN